MIGIIRIEKYRADEVIVFLLMSPKDDRVDVFPVLNAHIFHIFYACQYLILIYMIDMRSLLFTWILYNCT